MPALKGHKQLARFKGISTEGTAFQGESTNGREIASVNPNNGGGGGGIQSGGYGSIGGGGGGYGTKGADSAPNTYSGRNRPGCQGKKIRL